MAVKFKYSPGGEQTCVSLAASLADGTNTHAGHTGITQTFLDNSTDLYPHAKFVLIVPETFAAAPSVGAYFDIWMTMLSMVNTTQDEAPTPVATDIEYLARRVGVIPIDNTDGLVRKPLIVPNILLGVEYAYFYVRNKTGQATTYASSPLILKVTPLTFEDV